MRDGGVSREGGARNTGHLACDSDSAPSDVRRALDSLREYLARSDSIRRGPGARASERVVPRQTECRDRGRCRELHNRPAGESRRLPIDITGRHRPLKRRQDVMARDTTNPVSTSIRISSRLARVIEWSKPSADRTSSHTSPAGQKESEERT